jgi:hypothetical protein
MLLAYQHTKVSQEVESIAAVVQQHPLLCAVCVQAASAAVCLLLCGCAAARCPAVPAPQLHDCNTLITQQK